jgi:hypothetical protein
MEQGVASRKNCIKETRTKEEPNHQYSMFGDTFYHFFFGPLNFFGSCFFGHCSDHQPPHALLHTKIKTKNSFT